MAPNITKTEIVLECRNNETSSYHEEKDVPPREYKLVWRNIILYIFLHLSALYGFWIMFTSGKILTSVWGKV